MFNRCNNCSISNNLPEMLENNGKDGIHIVIRRGTAEEERGR